MTETKYLHLKAGDGVYERLMDKGLQIEDVRIMAGAAGGPKWIILYYLDLYLIQHFFSGHQQKIDFYGCSIGAWRSLAYVHTDPVAALNRLSYEYIHQRYSIDPSWSEVSAGCHQVVKATIGDGTKGVLNSEKRKLHIGVSQALFSAKNMTEGQLKRKYGSIAIQHFLSRKSLNRNVKRLTFSNSTSIVQDDGINTIHAALDEQNLLPALQASGTIPLIMDPVVIDGKDCWDGGLVDYHIDLKFEPDGLVFQPHFFPYIKPGWFDKHNPIRRSKYHQNTLLLYPSKELISMMPQQKLTETKDFYTYANDTDGRIKMWLQAKELGKHLAEDFERLLDIEVLRKSLQRL